MLAAVMRIGVAFLMCVLASGCQELSDFRTGPGEVYRGEVFGQPDDSCGPGVDCSFIRRGFSSAAVLDMVFDPSLVYSDPGSITVTGEPCGATFDSTPLSPIAPLAHDQLALYEFPGGARVRNYIFSARPTTGPLAGRDAMVFVSLIRGGRVETRIMTGGSGQQCDPADCAQVAAGDCDYFGVFSLSRQSQ